MMTEMTPRYVDDYECIDPPLGAQLWRRDDPDTEPHLRSRLDAHLAHCAACRLSAGVEREVAAGLWAGRLRLPITRNRPTSGSGILAAAGLTALVASLALVFLLTPQAPHADRVTRGDDEAGIVRPVPDEQIATERPTIRWRTLPDATSYTVTVRGVESDYSWTGTTDGGALRLPADRPIPSGERYRVSVETVPPDLAPRGGWRTSFSRVSSLEFLGYRIGAAPPLARWGGLAGLVAGLTGLALLLRRRV